MGSEIFIRYIAMPDTVRAVTLPNDDGTFDIYINLNQPEERQQQALEHELQHIRQGHFYNDDPVGMNEAEAGNT